MHGLINRSIQCFLRDTCGAATWTAVAREARLGFDSFEPMLSYDAVLTQRVLLACSVLLGRPLDLVLEDIGNYLVSNPEFQPMRRLLRFGGVSYREFIETIEDLPDRGRLALPDLRIPRLDLVAQSMEDDGAEAFTLRCYSPVPGAGHVIVGILRAMAEDYGAISIVEHQGSVPAPVVPAVQSTGEIEFGEQISILITGARQTAGRSFDLSAVEMVP